ncbi:hypothetical protein ACHQM5_006664 [Ranunculus cassubicifolius]
MEIPLLRLTVEKGPKEGETLEKKPGTKVRIGRVVKGNNFTIKDDGISSKHLLIEVKDLNWVIYDLDTSNGTFLNGVQIEPNSPFVLKNGDLIKIGELTSIKVGIGEEKVEEKDEKDVPKGNLGKGLKKIGKSVSTSVQVGDDAEDVGDGPVRRNTRRGVVAAKKQQVVESDLVSAVETRGGRGRGRKKAAPKNETVETVADGVAEVKIGDNNKVLSEPCVGDDSQSAAEVILSESPKVMAGDSSKGKKVVESPKVEVGDSSKGYPRRGAVAAKKQQLPESNSVSAVETRGVRGRPRKNAAPETKTVETVADGVAEVNIGDNNMVSRPDNSQSAAEMFVSESLEVIVGDRSKGKKVAESSKVEVRNSSKGDNVACDTATVIENSTNEEKMTLEKLQKMTLGEWFDYLEVYLVKQIYKETDEIIAGMRAKAEEFKKFMSEQQKLKNKSPVLRE